MTLTAEQLEIRGLAREFAENEIRPHAEAWDAAAEIPSSLYDNLAELGFLGMLIPEAYGGLELDVTTYLLVLEELARGDASVALAVAMHNGPVPAVLHACGSEEQRSNWLPRLAAGEVLGAFAAGAAGATGDVADQGWSAVADGDGWILSGTMPRVLNGARAGLVVGFAGVGDGQLSCFLLDPAADGYEVTRRVTTMGHSALEKVDVTLNGLSLPAEALVGEPGRGLAYAADSLMIGRLGVASHAVGIAQSAMEHAVRYSLERRQFGRSLAEFEATQAKLGNMAARISAVRAAVLEVGGRLQATRAGSPDLASGAEALAVRAAGVKLLAGETATYAADEAVQIFGGYGYMRDYPVERLMRDAKGAEIFEGSNEIMRVVIASEIIRAASDA